MKTTLDLPDELVRAVKLRAVTQGRTVKSLVTELLSQGLGLTPHELPTKPPVSQIVEVGDNGLPLIRCNPGAPAVRESAEELLRLEQESQLEEDIQRAGLAL